MLLITGAAGKTGQAVIRALHKRDVSVRALVYKDAHVQQIRDLGVKDIVVGDMGSQRIMDQALADVTAVYHICPNVHPHELEIGKIVIKAAQAAQVDRFVYHSVFHSQIEAMPHHWQKMRVEEQLFTSGLAYTILQPAPYMQNILAYWQDIKDNGTYQLPYSPHTRLGYVDLEDVAAAAALVLCEPGHAGAIYELCSNDSLSAAETAQIISEQLGQTVTVKSLPITIWQENARKNRLSEYQINTLIKMFNYYDQFGYIGNPNMLTSLLKRPPTSFSAFVTRIIDR